MDPVNLLLSVMQIRYVLFLIFLLLQLDIKLLINVVDKLIRRNLGC